MRIRPFAMERWQSTYENRVRYNLSESGVHPLRLDELLDLADVRGIGDTLLGYGQSNGSDPLRATIADLYTGAGPDQVVVTNGSAEANFVALWELLEPGDEAAIIVPCYMQGYGLAEAFGAAVREIPLREDLGWQPDPDEVRRAVGPGTRLVLVTNPNNPTGSILNADARRAIVEAADAAGAWILADEVYAGAEIDAPTTPSFFGEYPRTIATGSLSKAYGLPGLRIGWAVAPHDLAARLWARTDYTSISTGDLTDRLARLALLAPVRERILDRTRTTLREGLRILNDWAAELRHDDTPVLRFRPPEAGAIGYLHYRTAIPSLTLAERLRVDQDVLLVPGHHFGMESHIRIGYGLPPADLRAALARVAALLAPPS